jgi:hypothetical protein
MRRRLALVALATVLAACNRTAGDPLPRHFMPGGVWYPAATGYWFHQYAESDELERLMKDLDFTCAKTPSASESRLRCERGFRLPGGILSRTDYAEFAFRRNGAIALAESGCRYAFFDSPSLSGTCAQYAAKGAVYPGIETFSAMAEAMLRGLPMNQPISVYRTPQGVAAPLQDANAAVDQLARWRFECESPKHQYTPGFRGNTGEILELRCQQWSLRTPQGAPQSQQVVIRYDSVDLAVLGVTARLDDVAAALSPTFHTPRDASAARGAERDRAPGPPASLALETINGERFEMPLSAVGTGSRQATREGFVTLTPESQRVLVQAYIERQARQWNGKVERLSHANLLAMEWYGPDAIPHIEALMSDERPEVGAALVKYVCFEVPLRAEASSDAQRLSQAMSACVDSKRGSMPRSIEAMDRMLAQDMRVLASSDARALNAFFDFKRDVIYVYALGRDAKASGVALEETVAGKKNALEPGLAGLVASALTGRDRPAIAVPSR